MQTAPTDCQIAKLRDEACRAQDWGTADICADALAGDENALAIVRVLLGGDVR